MASAPLGSWDLARGQSIERKLLSPRYGGSPQGGISHSRKTPNVLVFSDERAGKQHGHVHDGWRDDGCFHYTGEGKYGDQRLAAQGNEAILRHKAGGRALRVFRGSSGPVSYLDEF